MTITRFWRTIVADKIRIVVFKHEINPKTNLSDFGRFYCHLPILPKFFITRWLVINDISYYIKHYREYHKMISMRLWVEWGVTFLYLYTQNRCPLRGKRGSKGKQVHKFSFYTWYSYLHASCTLLADFEIFYIFCLEINAFLHPKSSLVSLGYKVELSVRADDKPSSQPLYSNFAFKWSKNSNFSIFVI